MSTMRNEILSALKSAQFGDTENYFQAFYCFNPALSVFQGHFPGRPVLPGVFQIEMMRIALEKICKKRYTLVEVNKAKFSSMILPGEEILINARILAGDENTQIAATLEVEQKVKANISITVSVKKDT